MWNLAFPNLERTTSSWTAMQRCRRRALPRPRVPNLRECRLGTKTSTCDKKCARLRLEPRVVLLADRVSTAAVCGMTEKTVGSSETFPWLQSPGSDRSPPPTNGGSDYRPPVDTVRLSSRTSWPTPWHANGGPAIHQPCERRTPGGFVGCCAFFCVWQICRECSAH